MRYGPSSSQSSRGSRANVSVSRSRRLAIEPLEGRLLLTSVFTVTSTDDSGPGTLRQAILDANHSANLSEADTIAFDIPGAGPHTIQPLTALPTITDPVVVDGYTQPGASPNTNPTGSALNTVLKIELDGGAAGNAWGLVLAAGQSTVRGLAIGRFQTGGVVITGNGDNVIEGNFIGTDTSGLLARGNAIGVGIVDGSSSNLIGAKADGVSNEHARNLIAASTKEGIWIHGSDSNVVAGNFIGTDMSGVAALGNGWHGVSIVGGSSQNVIGTDGSTDNDAEQNVVSGNKLCGVLISGTGTNENIVAGNFLGTDRTAVVALPNGNEGVLIGAGAQSNRVGTDGNGIGDQAERNVISGNGRNGVGIANEGTNFNSVAGNLIGTESDRHKAIGQTQIRACQSGLARSRTLLERTATVI